jgi:hypothetical protein
VRGWILLSSAVPALVLSVVVSPAGVDPTRVDPTRVVVVVDPVEFSGCDPGYPDPC